MLKANAPVRNVLAEIGKTVELPCLLPLSPGTETQHWNYHPVLSNTSNSTTRFATYWPGDDEVSSQDPSPAFTGKWNLTHSFGVLLRDITQSMSGYFQCGKSLTNGSEIIDSPNYLLVTDTNASAVTFPETSPEIGSEVSNTDGLETSAFVGIVLSIVIVLLLLILAAFIYGFRFIKDNRTSQGEPMNHVDLEERNPLVAELKTTKSSDISIVLTDTYGFSYDVKPPDTPLKFVQENRNDLNNNYNITRFKILKRLGEFSDHLEKRLQVNPNDNATFTLDERTNILEHLIETLTSEIGVTEDMSPSTETALVNTELIKIIFNKHSARMDEKGSIAALAAFAAAVWVWFGTFDMDKARILRTKILSGLTPKECEAKSAEYLELPVLSKYGSLCSLSSFMGAESTWVDQTLHQVVGFTFFWVLVSELKSRSDVQQKELEKKLNQFLLQENIKDQEHFEEIRWPDAFKWEEREMCHEERIAKYFVKPLLRCSISLSMKKLHMLRTLKEIIYRADKETSPDA